MAIYQIRKDVRGNWRAETVLMLTDTLQLSIVTSKRHTGDLVTIASCGHLENGFVSHTVYQDYNNIIDRSSPKRITQKVVEKQHLDVYLPWVRDNALEFYNLELVN